MENIVMFLVTKNVFSANPFLIYKTPVNIVLDTYNYLKFVDEYQNAVKILNQKES